MILTVRVTRGREKTVLETLDSRVKAMKINIKAIFYPEEISGYIFVEGDEKDIEELVKNVRHVRGLIKKDVSAKELEKFLSEEKKEIELEKGDIVEIISGPFKDELAKVDRVDKINRQIVVELLETAVPIPITIDADIVRKKK
jgi:transcriptional antiterminator NusG